MRFGKRPWEGGLVSTAGHQPLIGAFEPTERCSITCWRRILMHSSRLGLVVSTSALALMLSTAPIAPSKTGWLSPTAALAASASAQSSSHSDAGGGVAHTTP